MTWGCHLHLKWDGDATCILSSDIGVLPWSFVVSSLDSNQSQQDIPMHYLMIWNPGRPPFHTQPFHTLPSRDPHLSLRLHKCPWASKAPRLSRILVGWTRGPRQTRCRYVLRTHAHRTVCIAPAIGFPNSQLVKARAGKIWYNSKTILETQEM